MPLLGDTHHAPHRLSVHRKFVEDPLTPAFVSDLTEQLRLADLWIHGHVHDSFDYSVGRCRSVANPAGYPLNRTAKLLNRSDLKLENADFKPGFVVDV